MGTKFLYCASLSFLILLMLLVYTTKTRAFYVGHPQLKEREAKEACLDKNKVLGAAAAGHLPELKRLIRQGNIQKHRADCDGNTLLHIAVANGHKSVVHFLLKQGFSSEVRNAQGVTPLQLAKDEKRYELLPLLSHEGRLH